MTTPENSNVFPIKSREESLYGDLPLIQSTDVFSLDYFELNNLKSSDDGREIYMRARI